MKFPVSNSSVFFSDVRVLLNNDALLRYLDKYLQYFYFLYLLFWYFLSVVAFSFPDLMTILFNVYLTLPTKYSTVGTATGIVKKKSGFI
jgi:hypothetical protein